ncbi:hypothetical protein AC1031_015523 [Aphanomyces cochlioides]|nr:hypothetical protein AC1031_015523 [Aphanomyces cochlioides]
MIINVDETAVHYDMPPMKTLAKVGGSSKVDSSEKHSDRLTAVLSVRSNGEKLPILFIVKGTPGGLIERQEVPTFPRGHVYVVQENAWMDSRVWEKRRLRYMWLFEKPVFTAADKRMAMIKRTIKAWEEMSSDMIRSSFCKAIPKSLGNESHEHL